MHLLDDSIPEERDSHNNTLIDRLGRIYGHTDEKPALEHVREEAVTHVLERLQVSLQQEQQAPPQPARQPLPLHNGKQNGRDAFATTLPSGKRFRPGQRSRRIIESGLALVLVASLLVAWLAVVRLPHSQGTPSEQKPLFTYTGQQGETTFSMQWTPDDRYLTFIFYKGISDLGPQQYRFLVWDRQTSKLRQTLIVAQRDDETHHLMVNVSPDGKYAFIETDNVHKTTVKIENLITGQTDLVAMNNVLTEPQFSPDSQRLAYVGTDNRIHIWNILARKTALISDSVGNPNTTKEALSWLSDGKSLVLEVSSNPRPWDTFTMQIWNTVTGHKLRSISSTASMRLLPSMTGGLSPDGQYLISYNNSAGMVQVRDTATLNVLSTFHTGALVKEDSFGALIQGLKWTAEGKRIFSRISDGKGWQVWNPENGQVVLTIATQKPDDTSQITVPLNNLLLSEYKGKPIEVWDMLTGKRISTIQLTAAQPLILGSPNDRYALIGSGTSLFLYNLQSGERLAAYQGNSAWLSANDRYIALGNDTPVAKQNNVTTPTIKVMRVP